MKYVPVDNRYSAERRQYFLGWFVLYFRALHKERGLSSTDDGSSSLCSHFVLGAAVGRCQDTIVVNVNLTSYLLETEINFFLRMHI
jgi:hypothetical protein